jgi:hypothetical protein
MTTEKAYRDRRSPRRLRINCLPIPWGLAVACCSAEARGASTSRLDGDTVRAHLKVDPVPGPWLAAPLSGPTPGQHGDFVMSARRQSCDWPHASISNRGVACLRGAILHLSSRTATV